VRNLDDDDDNNNQPQPKQYADRQDLYPVMNFTPSSAKPYFKNVYSVKHF
jgi:hypothetical protein